MRKTLIHYATRLLTPQETARIASIKMPVTTSYEQILKELCQEVKSIGFVAVQERMENEALVLEQLQKTQEALDKEAYNITLEGLVIPQAQGESVELAIHATAKLLAQKGLDTQSRKPLNEQVSGLRVRGLLFQRNYDALVALPQSKLAQLTAEDPAPPRITNNKA